MFLRFFSHFLHVAPDDLGYVRRSDPPAAEREGVVDEHRVAAPGQFVGPGGAAVIVLLMALHQRVKVRTHPRDFAQPEIFVARVVVQRERRRQPPLHTDGLEEGRLRGRPVRLRPLQKLHVQPVDLELTLHHRPRRGRTVGASANTPVTAGARRQSFASESAADGTTAAPGLRRQPRLPRRRRRPA
jgi:hypothetical protein